MGTADEWFSDGRHYAVTVFSDVSTRDGLGWELDDVAPAPTDAILTEVTLRIDGESVLLIAADPIDGDRDRHLYDESVTVLRDPSAADRLEWYQPRPTHGRPRE